MKYLNIYLPYIFTVYSNGKTSTTFSSPQGAFGHQRDSSYLLDRDNVIVTTRSHSNQLVNDAIEACKPSHVERVGGAGNKVSKLSIKSIYY